MSMIRWEQIGVTGDLRQAIERLFEDIVARSTSVWRELTVGDLRLDMYQTAKEVVVKVPMPGVNPEGVDISIIGDTLTVKGEYSEDRKVRQEDYFQRECRCGAFSRSVTVPVAVKNDRTEAVFENGVLTLTLQKTGVVRPRQINVKPETVLKSTAGSRKGPAKSKVKDHK